MSAVSRDESGFTLIELLTVISLIGILAALGFRSYTTYISSAGYAVARTTLKQAQTSLEASFSMPDAVYPNVNHTQTVQGNFTDASARTVFPEFQVPGRTSVSVYHDSACTAAACVAERIQVRHCRGQKYTFWSRWGDGSEVLMEDVPGAGC